MPRPAYGVTHSSAARQPRASRAPAARQSRSRSAAAGRSSSPQSRPPVATHCSARPSSAPPRSSALIAGSGGSLCCLSSSSSARASLVTIASTVVATSPSSRRSASIASSLVLRRPALPAVERAVQRVEVLADPLLAGDRAALLGGDDQLARGLQLVAQRAQLAGQRVGVGQALEPVVHGRARGVDPQPRAWSCRRTGRAPSSPRRTGPCGRRRCTARGDRARSRAWSRRPRRRGSAARCRSPAGPAAPATRRTRPARRAAPWAA